MNNLLLAGSPRSYFQRQSVDIIKRNNLASQRTGAVLPLVTFLLVALMLVLSLMVELSWLNFRRFESQSAADLASKSALSLLYDNRITLDAAAIEDAKSLGSLVFNQNSQLADSSISELQFGKTIKATNAFEEIRNASNFREITAAKFDINQPFQPILGSLMAKREIGISSTSVAEANEIEIMLCIDASRSMNNNATNHHCRAVAGLPCSRLLIPSSKTRLLQVEMRHWAL